MASSTTFVIAGGGLAEAKPVEALRDNDFDGREFVAFWLDGVNRVPAGMNVNIWDVLEDVKALIRSQVSVDPDRLADPGSPLADLLG